MKYVRMNDMRSDEGRQWDICHMGDFGRLGSNEQQWLYQEIDGSYRRRNKREIG